MSHPEWPKDHKPTLKELAIGLVDAELGLESAVRMQLAGKPATICETPVLYASSELFYAIKSPDDLKAAFRIIREELQRRGHEDR